VGDVSGGQVLAGARVVWEGVKEVRSEGGYMVRNKAWGGGGVELLWR
jgi:hypothetical protein